MKEMNNVVNIRIDMHEEVYDRLLEITHTYFKGKPTIDEVIECALAETFSDLQMCESNPRLSVKRYADMLVQLKNRFIKEPEVKQND